ncbi:MAG: fused MFS/spermidine synthase [Candidatus Methylacidiphilales bacterium]|nr:fused MFS/spermidine synthase [Candidatus Methylacidiphilales bacterium]
MNKKVTSKATAVNTKATATTGDTVIKGTPAENRRTLERFILCLTCFLSGASVLIMEMSGNRVLAPTFGNSLYTWTGLIGIILVSIALGDYLGGWLIDRWTSKMLVPLLLVVGAALLIFTCAILPSFAQMASTWEVTTGPMKASLLLFFLPALVLSSVTPVCVRLFSQTTGDQDIGLSSGTIGMFGTLGSFAGTMLAGFVLIPMLDVRVIFMGIGGLLILVAIVFALFFRVKDPALIIAPGLILLLIGVAIVSVPEAVLPGTMFTKSTYYHKIRVFDQESMEGDKLRMLQLDTTNEGGINLTKKDVVFEYQHYWQMAQVFCPDLEKALFFGGGAFGMPRKIATTFPKARIDVVEIDPELIRVGDEWFGLKDFPTIAKHGMDARVYLRKSPDKYDFIFGDAYNGIQHIPPHLLTKEFFAEVKSHMTEKGVFMMNLISTPQGPKSELFRSVVTTLSTTFPAVMTFAIAPETPTRVQNLILVAGNSKEELEAALAAHNTEPFKSLIDNRIPTEKMPDISDSRLVLTDWRNNTDLLVARQISK